jgi:acyl carrier protein
MNIVGTQEKIQTIIAANLGTPLERVHADTRAEDLVEWDALHQFQIVTEIEDAFGFKFNLQELAELDSVEKIVKAVQLRALPVNAPAGALTTETVVEVLKSVRPEGEFLGVDDFFARGILDSLDLTMLVSALEERLGIAINGLHIVPQNFRSIKAIMGLLAKYGVAA